MVYQSALMELIVVPVPMAIHHWVNVAALSMITVLC